MEKEREKEEKENKLFFSFYRHILTGSDHLKHRKNIFCASL
jgi:hypothetical protein